eukprot:TRINITY_DN2440_c1_g1_i1.p1 TRINITY_DN2440_c1_g1~~TRINITY_DN2440_c1_g1_i1.p1  ORF type:complete len:234 (+),score=116.18 TRINITY_DN2440_c1_g1_i1:98-703(+)
MNEEEIKEEEKEEMKGEEKEEKKENKFTEINLLDEKEEEKREEKEEEKKEDEEKINLNDNQIKNNEKEKDINHIKVNKVNNNNNNNKNEKEEEKKKASKEFANEMFTLINHSDINTCLHLQHDIYERLQESSQALVTFNQFSSKLYNQIGKDFEQKTKMIIEMKKDLDNIFRRIRALKDTLQKKYPNIKVDVPKSDIEEEE